MQPHPTTIKVPDDGPGFDDTFPEEDFKFLMSPRATGSADVSLDCCLGDMEEDEECD